MHMQQPNQEVQIGPYHLGGTQEFQIGTLTATLRQAANRTFVYLQTVNSPLTALTPEDIELLVQLLIEAEEPVEYSLLDKLQKLEKENAELVQTQERYANLQKLAQRGDVYLQKLENENAELIQRVATLENALENANIELDDKAVILEAEKDYVQTQFNRTHAEYLNRQQDALRTKANLQDQLEGLERQYVRDMHNANLASRKAVEGKKQRGLLIRKLTAALRKERLQLQNRNLNFLTVHDEIQFDVPKLDRDTWAALIGGTGLIGALGALSINSIRPKGDPISQVPISAQGIILQKYSDWSEQMESYRKGRQSEHTRIK